MVKDVRDNCFCASLLSTKFTCHIMHQARVLSSKVNNNRANGHSYNFACIYDLGSLVTPILLSMDCFLLLIFYGLQKNEENLSSRSFNFLQNGPSNSVHLTSWFTCAAVSNASLRVKVCENDGNI